MNERRTARPDDEVAEPKLLEGDQSRIMDKIILADPQEIYRIGILKILTGVDHARIASQCADLERLLLAVEAYPASIVMFSSALTRVYANLMARNKAAKSRAVVIAEPGEAPHQFTAHEVWGVIYRDASSQAFVWRQLIFPDREF